MGDFRPLPTGFNLGGRGEALGTGPNIDPSCEIFLGLLDLFRSTVLTIYQPLLYLWRKKNTLKFCKVLCILIILMKIILNLVAQIPAKRQKIKIYVLKVMEWFGQFYIKKHEKQDHLPLRTNYK